MVKIHLYTCKNHRRVIMAKRRQHRSNADIAQSESSTPVPYGRSFDLYRALMPPLVRIIGSDTLSNCESILATQKSFADEPEDKEDDFRKQDQNDQTHPHSPIFLKVGATRTTSRVCCKVARPYLPFTHISMASI
jgi:hypothetical protein